MAFSSVTLKPGVYVAPTPTLLQAGYAASNLGRFRAGLWEKIGGWTKYYPFTLGGLPRALHAWQDLNALKWLAVGTTNGLNVITSGVLTDITPTTLTSDFTPNFSTTSGLATVTVQDFNISDITTYDSVEFKTPISVGGIILSGKYAISLISSSTQYQIVAASVATSTVSGGGAVPVFMTTSGSAVVTVAFNDHGMSAGGSIVFPVSTTVGGVTISGTYSVLVTPAPSANSFSISATLVASATETVPMNDNGNDAYTKVLLHMNGVDASTTFTDTNTGGAAKTWTAAGNAQIDTATYVFGGGSGLFDGTLDAIRTPDSTDFTLGTSDFTVDCWFAVGGGAGTTRSLFGQADATGAAGLTVFGFLNSSNVLFVGVSTDGTTTAASITGTTTLTTGSWHHFAVVRTGNTLKLFVDGVQEGGDVSYSGTINDSANDFGVGSLGQFTLSTWFGWIDEFRLSVGTARWTTDFTPPTASYGGNAEIIYYIAIGPISAGTTYSFSTYSSGTYSGIGSSGSQQLGTAITATDWSLDNWGSTLLACPADGGIYAWTPNGGLQNLQLVSGAPIHNGGMFTATPYQILIAWGSTVEKDIGVLQDPLTWRGSDILDYTYWEIGTINPATGDFSQAYTNRIPTGSAIKAGMATPQQILLWTDLDLWSLNYLGPPLIWGQTKIGANCGTLGRHSVAQMAGVVYWWSGRNFFAMAGGSPQIIPCSVWDVVFQDLDEDNTSKCWIETVQSFSEVWFFYPSESGGTGECDSYAKVNVIDGAWDYGELPRSAGIDRSVLGTNIMATPTGVLYSHESGYNADSAPLQWSFTTGWFMLQEGEDYLFVDQFYPDFKYALFGQADLATINITFETLNFQGATVSYGPYAMDASTQKLDLRMRGRQWRMTMSGDDLGTFVRLGKPRFRIAPSGRR